MNRIDCVELADKLTMFMNINLEQYGNEYIKSKGNKITKKRVGELDNISIKSNKKISAGIRDSISNLSLKEYAQICALQKFLAEYKICDNDLLKILKRVKDCAICYEALNVYPAEFYNSLADYVEKTPAIMLCISQAREEEKQKSFNI